LKNICDKRKTKRGTSTMAKPIAPTPVLEGEDAELLLKEIGSQIPDSKKAQFLKECASVFDRVQIRR
jgi:hypothetical protein